MYDRLVRFHGIRNLLWVWTADPAEDALEWFPGADVVDVVGADIYGTDHGAQSAAFEKLRALWRGAKIVALSECGPVPDARAAQEAGATWSWFMAWYRGGTIPAGAAPPNAREFWKRQMAAPFVVGLDRMPGWR